MNGTTICPYCDTSFKITNEQLTAYQGMARCGQCMETFDALLNFIPDELDPQTGLPVLDDISSSNTGRVVLQPMILAEQAAISKGNGSNFLSKKSNWPWAFATLLLLLVLMAQAIYFFRIDIAARLPKSKPFLVNYCKILKCTVPLPRNADLISIESSDMSEDADGGSRVFLTTLLRNRAAYIQAFPSLELTLNDSLDMPIARRTFTPSEYLPPTEHETSGMHPGLELNIKLHLDTANLRPSGYRLAIIYPNSSSMH